MRDQSKNGHESTLSQLRHREEEIMKEVNHDIAGMHDDLMQLVNDFTFVLSEKAEKDCAFGSSLISDVNLQLRRLNETVAVISCFSGVLQQFNSMTSKVLTNHDCDLKSHNAESPKNERMSVTPVQIDMSEVQNIRFPQRSLVGEESNVEGDFSDEVIVKKKLPCEISVAVDVVCNSDKRKRVYSEIDAAGVKCARAKGGC